MTKIDQKRARLLANIPGWYSGILHFLLINTVGLAMITLCLLRLENPAWWEWGFVPGFFVLANGFEWWIHRGPMHHPTRLLRYLYNRHTLEHHIIFPRHLIGLQSSRQLYYVLFPPFFLPLFLLLNLPIPLVLGLTVSANLGYLFFASVFAYYLVYEWFHLLHHLPPSRLGFVRGLQLHHTRHHELARMAEGNFNVSFPLWDLLLGSCLKGDPPFPSPQEADRSRRTARQPG